MLDFLLTIEDSKKLQSFLKNIESDHITIVITKRVVFLLGYTAPFYIQKSFIQLTPGIKDELLTYRIPKNMFVSLLRDGFIRFVITNEKTKLIFLNTKQKVLYESSITTQIDGIEKFKRMIDLTESANEYCKEDLSNYSQIISVSSRLNLPLTCDGEYIFIAQRDMYIFQKANIGKFCSNGKFLNNMMKINYEVNMAQNFLISSKDSYTIMLQQQKGDYESSIDFIINQPYLFKCSLKLENMIDLCKSLKLKDGEFVIDISNEECHYYEESKGNHFKSKIDVENLVKAGEATNVNESGELDTSSMFTEIDFDDITGVEETKLPALVIPPRVIQNILSCFSKLIKINMVVKKKFVVMTIGRMRIAFRRRDYE